MLNDYTPFSFKHKLKSSIRCFRPDHSNLVDNNEDDSSSPKTPKSPRAWLKSTANDIPELRGRCRNLVVRFTRSRRRYHHSADFSYDPSSYALNFEDDSSREYDDQFRPRDFTSRLPVSPPTTMGFPARK